MKLCSKKPISPFLWAYLFGCYAHEATFILLKILVEPSNNLSIDYLFTLIIAPVFVPLHLLVVGFSTLAGANRGGWDRFNTTSSAALVIAFTVCYMLIRHRRTKRIDQTE